MDVHEVARKYLDRLQDQRDISGIDAPPAIEKFVLKSGKKFFYGMKKNEAVWTYDKSFALAITKHEAEALAFWLGPLGIATEQMPVLTEEAQR